MKGFMVFLNKELLSASRGGKTYIIAGVFLLLGAMNPALVYYTPRIMEALADQLAESGMSVANIPVNASASWAQFVKNIPVALIVFAILCAGVFTREYRSGTLVLFLTRGLKRWQVLLAKTAVLILGWSVGYFLSFGVTYAANAVLWDNSIVEGIGKIALSWWLFGVWTVVLMVFFSVPARNMSTVLLGTAGGVLVSYVLSLLPKLAPYMPTRLMSGAGDINKALMVTAVMCVALLIAAVPMFNKKEI